VIKVATEKYRIYILGGGALVFVLGPIYNVNVHEKRCLSLKRGP